MRGHFYCLNSDLTSAVNNILSFSGLLQMVLEPKYMDGRMKKLEAQVIELSNKVDTISQATHNLMEKFDAHMVSEAGPRIVTWLKRGKKRVEESKKLWKKGE